MINAHIRICMYAAMRIYISTYIYIYIYEQRHQNSGEHTANTKCANQSALMRRQICAFVFAYIVSCNIAPSDQS